MDESGNQPSHLRVLMPVLNASALLHYISEARQLLVYHVEQSSK
jgi:hypothetical protein